MDELQPLARLEGEIGSAAPELVGRVLLRQETENTVDLNWRTQPKPLATMPQTRNTLPASSAVNGGPIPPKTPLQRSVQANLCQDDLLALGPPQVGDLTPTRGPL